MRYAARVDENHQEIIDAFRAHGFYVLDISKLKNCCDLMVSKNLQTIAIEIKDGNKPRSKQRLTEGETIFKEKWQGCYAIVTCIKDVQFIAGGIREADNE